MESCGTGEGSLTTDDDQTVEPVAVDGGTGPLHAILHREGLEA